MKTEKLPNIDATQITVTDTATDIETLISTAGGEDYRLDPSINACDLQIESEGIRYCIDGNTPTSSKGFPLDSDGTNIVVFRGEDIKKLKLIRSGGTNSKVNIRIGRSL